MKGGATRRSQVGPECSRFMTLASRLSLMTEARLGCTAAELGAYWRSTGWDQNRRPREAGEDEKHPLLSRLFLY